MVENKVSQRLSTDENKGTEDSPLVSIITPVLNGIKFLEACLQSLLNQSYPNIEHIFVDGGSTDGTLDMLLSYQSKYPDRIRFISEPDKGAGEASYKGWTMAKGEIIGWLGSDDLYEPDTAQTVVEFFRANPDACFVFGGCDIINKKGELIAKAPTKDFDLEEAINDNCYVPTPSSFCKREVIEKVGFIMTGEMMTDLDYCVRVGRVFPIHRIEKVLCKFRVHEGSSGYFKQGPRVYMREGFIISRRYGGRRFSPRVRRYYKFVIIEGLRPALGFTYPLIRKVLRK